MIVRLALEELDADYETILVDRSVTAHKSKAYLRLNPNGLIPVLETPDGPIFETAAILLWLTDRYRNLGPVSGAPERTQFLKWLFFLSNTVHPALRMQFYPWAYVGADEAAQKALCQKTAQNLLKYFGVINDVAAGADSVVGGQTPNCLDLYIAPALRWLRLYPALAENKEMFVLNQWPHLFDMCQRLENRQSVSALCCKEGMSPEPFTQPQPPNPPEGSVL